MIDALPDLPILDTLSMKSAERQDAIVDLSFAGPCALST
jgi:hypothetical protein